MPQFRSTSGGGTLTATKGGLGGAPGGGGGIGGLGVLSVKIFGAAALIRSIRSTVRFVGPALDTKLMQMAKDIFNASQVLVPVDTGELRDSGYVRRRALNSVEIGYTANHAYRIHQTPPFIMPHKPGKTWKFLERPAREAFANVEADFSINLVGKALTLNYTNVRAYA